MGKAGRKSGSIPWNKGKQTGHAPWLGKKRPFMRGNHFALGYKHSEEAKKKIGEAAKGRVMSLESRQKIAKAMRELGRPEHLKGPSNSRWKGLNRRSLGKIVFKRDNFKCVKCGGEAKEIDHIIQVKLAPDRFGDFSNLQSLCKKCHRIRTNQELKSASKSNLPLAA